VLVFVAGHAPSLDRDTAVLRDGGFRATDVCLVHRRAWTASDALWQAAGGRRIAARIDRGAPTARSGVVPTLGGALSRSKHTTHRDWHEAHEWDEGNAGRKRRRIEAIEAELRDKRHIKRRVRAGRALPAPHDGAPVDVDTVRIEVRETGPLLHYPATPDDLREVLRRLPRGAANGLARVTLRLGQDLQREYADDHAWADEVDPLGRPATEVFPGIFSPYVVGCYRLERGAIELFAHVRSHPDAPTEPARTLLRVQYLAAFVHELGHHEDRSRRTSGDRWRMDRTDAAEMYAESREYEWVREAVLPYLEETDGPALAELRAWLVRHLGVDLPLEALVGDPRTTRRGGAFSEAALFGSPMAAVAEVAMDLHRGVDPRQVRRDFAVQLHFSGEYDLPMRIVDRLLAEDPHDHDSAAIKADLYHHLEDPERAMALVDEVLAVDPDHAESWRVRAQAARDRRRWADVLQAHDAIARIEGSLRGFEALGRARALLELGRFDEAQAAVQARPKPSFWGHVLLTLVALRRGDLAEALALAEDGLERFGNTVGRYELLAARWECRVRLGRPAEPLDEETLDRVARHRHDGWVEALRALGRDLAP